VESEPHYFGGSSNVHDEEIDYIEVRKTFSTPEGAGAFVDRTGIDTFAAAVGNLHGRYRAPKQLDLELLQRIRDAIDVNISLHGDSGTPGHYFEAAARIGVSKVNVNSDLRYAYGEQRRRVEELARELGCHWSTVRGDLRRLGLGRIARGRTARAGSGSPGGGVSGRLRGRRSANRGRRRARALGRPGFAASSAGSPTRA
jgi:Fructose-bisphosphate aldolase class-II